MPVVSTSPTYDRATITLHWLTAILVIGLWSLGQTIDWFPRGVPRTAARSIHIVTGVALLVILLVRAGWRTTRGRRLPPTDPPWLALLARCTHGALYALLLSTVLLGVTNTWVRGDSIFGLFRIPSIAPGDKALRGTIEDWHGLSANILLVVAGVHALAALFHHFVRRDGVLRRMLPSRATDDVR
jgi:cytochrome b561